MFSNKQVKRRTLSAKEYANELLHVSSNCVYQVLSTTFFLKISELDWVTTLSGANIRNTDLDRSCIYGGSITPPVQIDTCKLGCNNVSFDMLHCHCLPFRRRARSGLHYCILD
jgi:hypothetical protein